MFFVLLCAIAFCCSVEQTSMWKTVKASEPMNWHVSAATATVTRPLYTNVSSTCHNCRNLSNRFTSLASFDSFILRVLRMYSCSLRIFHFTQAVSTEVFIILHPQTFGLFFRFFYVDAVHFLANQGNCPAYCIVWFLCVLQSCVVTKF